MMTSRQITLVQDSFRQVEPVLEAATAMFYERLFELDPSLRGLFHRSREEQGRMLAQALTVVVKGIDQPEQLKKAVKALGERHAGYGVRDEHYATVGAALLWTLEQGLGEAFTPEVREAWAAAYGWLAFTMQRAAEMRLAQDAAAA